MTAKQLYHHVEMGHRLGLEPMVAQLDPIWAAVDRVHYAGHVIYNDEIATTNRGSDTITILIASRVRDRMETGIYDSFEAVLLTWDNKFRDYTCQHATLPVNGAVAALSKLYVFLRRTRRHTRVRKRLKAVLTKLAAGGIS